MAEAKVDEKPDCTLPDNDSCPGTGQKSKQHSPLRRGLTRMSKWVHAARRSLSSGEESNMGHGISSPATRRSDPPKESACGVQAETSGPTVEELQDEIESLKQLVEEKEKIIADLKYELQHVKQDMSILLHLKL
ncbi:uncharacterized protein TNIN_387591 [Trichonephila inaurata madagascariensis]|uniref:Uncharacterized protein n=1 Tax=Trichonephila inaurata madagascariensis TaxID=2747483 RepID=A0A8X6YCE3_9ARAC|nr:uncharacterized protein TNIN_387591 [Trichonephila inaurata madagascariensis]